MRVAEELLKCIRGLGIAHESSQFGHVTVSIGAASMQGRHGLASPLDLVEAADQALYRAKAAGRNAVPSLNCRSCSLGSFDDFSNLRARRHFESVVLPKTPGGVCRAHQGRKHRATQDSKCTEPAAVSCEYLA
jgi:hypothetical protein